MKYVHIACNSVHPEEEDVLAFLKIVTDPQNQPVLVHCNRGADRSGMMAAAYRVVVQGWDKRRALDEMHELGFNDDLTPIERYIERLDPDALREKLASVKEPPAKYIP
jgi:protein tyrosine/serine phosphatase